MKIDFQEGSYSDFSPREASFFHKTLFENHMHYEKLRFQCERSCIKYLGIFLAISFALFIFVGKGLVSSYLIGVAIAGLTILVAYFLNMRKTFSYDKEVAHAIKQGMRFEKSLPQIAQSRIFHHYDSLKRLGYRCALMERLFPFTVIACLTATAGVLLTLPVSQWLSILIAGVSALAIIFFNVKFSKSIKSAIFQS